MPAPFILAALPAILNAVPEIIGLLGDRDKKSSDQYGKVAEKVVDIAIQATGATNAQEAAEKVANDPESAEQVRTAIREQWFDIVEAGGGGIGGAREFNLAASGTPFWKQPAFVISFLLLIPVYMLVTDVFFVHTDRYQNELLTQIVTAVLTIIGLIGAFWLGSSMSSRTKDEELIKRRS